MIKSGDVYLCIETVVMNGGTISFIKGRKYISDVDECLTNEQGITEHKWSDYWIDKHFVNVRELRGEFIGKLLNDGE